MSVATKGLILDIFMLTWLGCAMLLAVAGTAYTLEFMWRKRKERLDRNAP